MELIYFASSMALCGVAVILALLYRRKINRQKNQGA